MSEWNLYGGASAFRDPTNSDMHLSATSNDSNGAISGTMSVNKGAMIFTVSGTWVAMNPDLNRANSAVTLTGQTSDTAPYFLALTGVVDWDPGSRPSKIKAIEGQIVITSCDGNVPPVEPENWTEVSNFSQMRQFTGVWMRQSDT